MSETLRPLLELTSGVLVLLGSLFFLVSAVGLLRLPDFYSRIHAPTKAATLGVILLGLGAALGGIAAGDLIWLEDVAIVVFLFLTVPVSSQALARAARRRGVSSTPPDPEDE